MKRTIIQIDEKKCVGCGLCVTACHEGAADCAAYACAGFHQAFMQSKITLIGCPKLDESDYSEKMTAILKENEIKSVTVVRMEVPCCGGIENAVKTALQACGKMIPWQVTVVSTDGTILER